MKTISLFLLSLLSTSFYACLAQQKTDASADGIKKTINSFLYWYKTEEKVLDTKYRLSVGGYPDTTTIARINWSGVDSMLNDLRNTCLFSESYLLGFKLYFKPIDEELMQYPINKSLVKTDGLDCDLIFKTYEPEMILNHFNKGTFDKVTIIYNKAIARFSISKIVKLLFTLSHYKDGWVIDYIGFDNTSLYSLGRQ